MGLLDLNNDVFSIFLSFTDQTDALSLALASRDTFAMAIPRVMRDVTVNGSEGAGRLALLASTEPRRLVWVRRFRVSTRAMYSFGGKSPKFFQEVAQVLLNSPNLMELCLPKAESFLAAHPDLIEHLTSLESLRVVEFGGPGNQAVRLLASSKSCLQNISILSPLRVPPLASISSVRVWEASDADSHQLLGNSQWTGVREATWRSSYISLNALSYTFPNLTTLCLFANLYNFRTHPEVQYECGQSPWKNLDHIIGFIDDFAANQNNLFPIRRLTISESTPIGLWEARDAIQVLAVCSPVVLDLTFGPEACCDFLRESTPFLNRLKCLRTVLSDTTSIETLLNWIPSIGEHIGLIPLVAYCLCIRRPYTVTVDDTLMDWDFPTTLAESVPSTSFVALDMEEGGSRPIWWRVTRTGGVVRTKRVGNDVNDTVTDMLFSCDGKADVVAKVEAFLHLWSGSGQLEEQTCQ